VSLRSALADVRPFDGIDDLAFESRSGLLHSHFVAALLMTCSASRRAAAASARAHTFSCSGLPRLS
jgi:hypothetical protein